MFCSLKLLDTLTMRLTYGRESSRAQEAETPTQRPAAMLSLRVIATVAWCLIAACTESAVARRSRGGYIPRKGVAVSGTRIC
jgi:hypothetical protein